MNNGWIKLFRSLLEWEWWHERDTRDLFIYCLIAANHDEQYQCGMTIPRGSFITSRKRLSDKVGITEQSVRTSLARLTRTQELTVQSTNLYTIITVCNYDKYQAKDTNEQPTSNQENNQPINQRTTSEQPTIDENSTIEVTKQSNDTTDYNTDNYQEPQTNQQPTIQPTPKQPLADNSPKINQPTNQEINHKQEDIKNIIRSKEENNNPSLSLAREEALAHGGVIGDVKKLGEEVRQEIRNNGFIVGSLRNLYGLTPEQQEEYLGWFVDKLIVDGTQFKSRSDFRMHFNNWLRKRVQEDMNQQYSTNGNSTRRHQPKYSSEFLEGIAADIASGH
ncbi:MAG: MSCRAMM family adhesin SdrC [Bacteroidales bacterium]|nr:MSCRAMM family adhesin SdrC [Bacteroidales bacterium]